VKDKLAWNVHSSAGRRINRQYKPLKVMLQCIIFQLSLRELGESIQDAELVLAYCVNAS